MWRWILALCVFTGVPVAAQTVSPDGETYTAPGHIVDYTWHAGVAPANLDEVTVLYDGKPEWAVTDPIACYTACRAFLSCDAFMFSEPQLKQMSPTCRMLSDPGNLEVAPGSHLYLPK